MLTLRHGRLICKSQENLLKYSVAAFSSKGRNPKHLNGPQTVPTAEREPSVNDHANWELLGLRGYRFCLPGNVGLPPPRKPKFVSFKKVPRPKKQNVTLPDTNFMRHIEIVTQLASLSGELSILPGEPHNFKFKAMECPYLLKDQVASMFPNANIGKGPLTAVSIILRYTPKNFMDDAKRLLFEFEECARRVCSKLFIAGFWADYPTTEEFLAASENTCTDTEVLLNQPSLGTPGLEIIHLSGCILLIHAPLGESRILGWLFTSASIDDPKFKQIIQEENLI